MDISNGILYIYSMHSFILMPVYMHNALFSSIGLALMILILLLCDKLVIIFCE